MVRKTLYCSAHGPSVKCKQMHPITSSFNALAFKVIWYLNLIDFWFYIVWCNVFYKRFGIYATCIVVLDGMIITLWSNIGKYQISISKSHLIPSHKIGLSFKIIWQSSNIWNEKFGFSPYRSFSCNWCCSFIDINVINLLISSK